MKPIPQNIDTLLDIYEEIDRDVFEKDRHTIKFIDCNIKGFDLIKEFIMNNVHVVFPIRILFIKEEELKIEYKDVGILISFNIKGAY